MIPVVFYKCTADNRIVDKTNYVVRQASKDCNFYNQTGVMHPSILLAYDSNVVNSCNYFYIDEWKRWYYITGIEVMPGGRMIVTGSEDVLFSNKDDILALNAYVVRTENSEKSNSLIVDNKHPVKANRHCKTIRFDFQFDALDTENDRMYVLTVIGGT